MKPVPLGGVILKWRPNHRVDIQPEVQLAVAS